MSVDAGLPPLKDEPAVAGCWILRAEAWWTDNPPPLGQPGAYGNREFNGRRGAAHRGRAGRAVNERMQTIRAEVPWQ